MKMIFRGLIWCLILTGVGLGSQNPGACFLFIWPTARSTALAGCITGLADEQDAVYFNPGGLGFQEGTGGVISGGPWLPGLWPGMYYLYASAGYGVSFSDPLINNLNIGANWTYLTTGETDVINERGEFIGRYRTWDAALGIHSGINLSDYLGVGANLKFIYSYLVPDWVWKVMPELGIERGGTGGTFGADIGVLFKPFKLASIGLSMNNLGPNISYSSSGESDPLPRMLRLGVAFTPVDYSLSELPLLQDLLKVRLRGLVEFDKILVGAFSDTTKSFREQLGLEFRDMWKSVGVEIKVLPINIRVAYFEDITGQRGGFVYETDGLTYHYSLFDVFTRNKLGILRSIGLCWGLGLGIGDYIRLDFGSDASIYDFATTNWKLGLTIKQPERLVPNFIDLILSIRQKNKED